MRWLLRLLPRDYRAEYGEELMLTLSARAAEPRTASGAACFWLRELTGWIALVLRERARGDRANGAARPGVALATLGGIVGALALWLGGALVASHGIYWRAAHPVAVGTVALLGAAIGWELAAARSVRARAWRCTALLVLLLATLPAFRVVDHLYLARAAERGGVAFTVPGIELRSELLASGVLAPVVSHGEGFQATRYHAGPAGTCLLTVWRRQPDAPPYLGLAMLLLMTLTLSTHATRLRWAR